MAIPTKFLCKMGDYEMILDDVPLTAKVVDSERVTDALMPTSYFGSEEVFGVDLVNKDLLVICGGSKCLIFQIEHMCFMFGSFSFDRLPKSLRDFMGNPNICFVRSCPKLQGWRQGVAAGELAARVLKKQELFTETRVSVVAREVGVFVAPSKSKLTDAELAGRILTLEQVKTIMYDAFTSYRIASKLLSTLPSS